MLIKKKNFFMGKQILKKDKKRDYSIRYSPTFLCFFFMFLLLRGKLFVCIFVNSSPHKVDCHLLIKNLCMSHESDISE